jgi:hypothetical protein
MMSTDNEASRFAVLMSVLLCAPPEVKMFPSAPHIAEIKMEQNTALPVLNGTEHGTACVE